MNDEGIFIINDKVMFLPASNSLRAVNDGSRNFVLHTPSSQCLLILLQNNHQVVSHKYLFEEIWEKNGTIVTPNTLYQNIALIRKALKAAGLDEEIIKTVPKQGVKLSALITSSLSDEPTSIAHEVSDEPALKEDSLQVAEDIQEPSPSRSENRTDAISFTPSAVSERLRRSKFFSLVVPCTLITFFVYYLFVLSNTELDGEAFISDYLEIGTVNNCRVYSSYHGIEISKQKFATMVKLSGLTCQTGDIVYLTFNRMSQLSMIQRCDKPITNAQAVCQNYLYEEGTENEN